MRVQHCAFSRALGLPPLPSALAAFCDPLLRSLSFRKRLGTPTPHPASTILPYLTVRIWMLFNIALHLGLTTATSCHTHIELSQQRLRAPLPSLLLRCLHLDLRLRRKPAVVALPAEGRALIPWWTHAYISRQQGSLARGAGWLAGHSLAARCCSSSGGLGRWSRRTSCTRNSQSWR